MVTGIAASAAVTATGIAACATVNVNANARSGIEMKADEVTGGILVIGTSAIGIMDTGTMNAIMVGVARASASKTKMATYTADIGEINPSHRKMPAGMNRRVVSITQPTLTFPDIAASFPGQPIEMVHRE